MSMDGSFSLKSAVDRFFARCPKLLQGHPQLNYLSIKEDLAEDEVVNSLAQIFVHQSYTIPLIGCFRPIADRIVDKAVGLLRMGANLNFNSDFNYMEEDKSLEADGDEIVGSIDFHHRRGKGLTLHELACFALCRALDLAPFVKCHLLTYFEFSPPPFQRVLLMKGEVSDYLLPVRTSFRLLAMEPEIFSKLWDWSCFVQFVMVIDSAELKCYGNLILSVVLNSSDIGHEDDSSLWLKLEEFREDVGMEKLAAFIEPFEGKIIMDIEPPMKKQRLKHSDDSLAHPPFVMTPVLKKSHEMVVLSVKQKWPVLLYGPPGAGKTALIQKLARESGNPVISIHMDDQLDGKTLVGNYVCTEVPGEFTWQPGTLTQALQKGMWVVFEDIDKALSDVHSILLPLLEGAASFATGHGEDIPVSGSFRLFSTMTTSQEFTRNAEGGPSISVLWRRVMISTPNCDDMQSIIKTWYPKLEPLAENLIETFGRVNSIVGEQFLGHHYGSSASSVSLCRFTLRDLLKWCKRIDGSVVTRMDCGLSADDRDCIFREAVDVFAASLMPAEKRSNIVRDIAKLWTILNLEEETLYPSKKPVIQYLPSEFRIGRVTHPPCQQPFRKDTFVEIRSSLHVLERIACSVSYNEPVLLVGETGTGKTTLVQNLAVRLGKKLTVLNLSQQSDVADLLGGFKPKDEQFVCLSLHRKFEDLFSGTTSVKSNAEVLGFLQKVSRDKNWKRLLSAFEKYAADFLQHKQMDKELRKRWVKLEADCRKIGSSSGMIFSFVEGAFVAALERGEWILLDEVNLAPPETLQRIIGVLEGEYGSICLAEKGDVTLMSRHPNFRIFACMNPANDSGKRDLPYAIRSRFTEYFVDDVLDDNDLQLFIENFMEESHSDIDLKENIKSFYKEAKKLSEEKLQDGANQKPQYSLRSLYRALEYTREAKKKFGFQKAMYDGFCMFFVTLLDVPSSKIMAKTILRILFREKTPPDAHFGAYLPIKERSKSDDFVENYVLTESVREHLSNLARAIFIKRYPVLLQGPTSSGKTSLIRYLAAVTGHEFVRINNHEHTDLQEYLGSYVTDSCGKLVFQEGVLVKAVRKGYWIVLDELNLAPSDVLEALNRLLDDNRELYVPELCKSFRPHTDFMLFATQNPPNLYGGRKVLSRAFRNRFVELHVDEIPDTELAEILVEKCKIPLSHAKKMVNVMKDLQLHRQSSRAFAGKHGFITPRDLFRWANRYRVFGKSDMDHLARDGYYLLAERLRVTEEKSVVVKALEKHLGVKDIEAGLYTQDSCLDEMVSKNNLNVISTTSMTRLYFLVKRCYELREPVLLVGETGGGKTTVCQLLEEKLGSKLHTLNCHQYTETSDFLGGFYPIRDRSNLMLEFKDLIESRDFAEFHGQNKIYSDIGQATSIIDQLESLVQSYRQGLNSISARDTDTSKDIQSKIDTIEGIQSKLSQLHRDWEAIFKWTDGPLVQAMRMGDLFLVDEISLAEDSVLERLNSVLEPERKLSLAEKGGKILETVTAHENFLVLATMNPGGDYGKKELSPALRNRFTEIWVSSANDIDELREIALHRISHTELSLVEPMLKFWRFWNRYQLQTGRMLTIRDLLTWIDFINAMHGTLGSHDALLHGVFLVLLDGLSLGTGISKEYASKLRDICFRHLLQILKGPEVDMKSMEMYGWVSCETPEHNLRNTEGISYNADNTCSDLFGAVPTYIQKGSCDVEGPKRGFEFLAPTTRRNALRLRRAMKLSKPVLLEGSPGVGKTSLVVALGESLGHTVVRINLSEQTDMMDLLGSDLPVESDNGIKFAWSDGILLQALKQGNWVLLDELNLAPQSVLEGLNAILDHRAAVYIPELGRTFDCPPSFKVFACQNPSSQGSGRKGLPRSFLNRFTKVYLDELAKDDYHCICRSLYPSIPKDDLEKLIEFNKRIHEDTMIYHKFAQDGSPWEFNLRDVMRSCQIITFAPEKLNFDYFVNIVYIQRMRTMSDRVQVLQTYEEVFDMKHNIAPYPQVRVNSQYLTVGSATIRRNHYLPVTASNIGLNVAPVIRQSLEAVAHCIQHEWLCILVGPAASGKTSLIRLLAQLSGNRLNELNLSSATDISELLGSFEQYNALHTVRLIIAQVDSYVNEYLSLLSGFSKEEELVSRWLAFLSAVYSSSISGLSSMSLDFSLLEEIIEKLKLAREKISVSFKSEDLNDTMKAISKLQVDHEKRFASKFEWVTGPLIKAIAKGEWVVLKNANLCNPTVLDRMNSLVEHCGSITVNERGTVDGKQLHLHPHPNFRIFLTVNPVYGEVSRAMRNRGVEIFMMEPHWLLDKRNGNNCMQIELRDVERFLVLSGVPLVDLVASMAKAHLHARDKSLQQNVRITYFELAQWAQLFQRLLENGNQPMWSLQTSWEHTYLSSLGEAIGRNIISYAVTNYLSGNKLMEPTIPFESFLHLSGAWPRQFKLRDFILFPNEASVKQICMVLEYIGAEWASHELGKFKKPILRRHSTSEGEERAYINYMKTLGEIISPKARNSMIFYPGRTTKFDFTSVSKMLLFAANWTAEQATEKDIHLYILRLNWFTSQLHPSLKDIHSILCAFVTSMKVLLEDPIWKAITYLRQVESDPTREHLQPVPLPSLEFISMGNFNGMLGKGELLVHAIESARLSRLTYHQWDSERTHNYSDDTKCFQQLLPYLRRLEEKVLDMLFKLPPSDLLIQLYGNLLEDHALLWDAIRSSKSERLAICWHSLKKDVSKLQDCCSSKNVSKWQDFCSEEVKTVLSVGQTLCKVFQCSETSMLWTHGGHPCMPASANLHDKQQQLLQLCEFIWPTKANQHRLEDNSIEFVASLNPILRKLALEGLGMSSFIMMEHDHCDAHVKKLADIHNLLLTKYESEKYRLKAELGLKDHLEVRPNSDSCGFFSETVDVESGSAIWVDVLSIADSASFSLDLELLEKLSSVTLVDDEVLQQGPSGVSEFLESALEYSITHSTRSTQFFKPHQIIDWIVKAGMPVEATTAKKIKSSILEMWFWWHSSLWSHCPTFVKNFSRIDGTDIPQPYMLVQPVMTASVVHILESTLSIKEYSVHSLKIKIACCNLLEIPSSDVNSKNNVILSAARSLFQQIIYAHKKTFGTDDFAKIKMYFCHFQKNVATVTDIEGFCLLIQSSSDNRLKSLLDSSLLKLLLTDLQHSSADSSGILGHAWFLIGRLRFDLLVFDRDMVDPTLKYAYKYSLLEEKILLLKLENKVRQECEYLAGGSAFMESDKKITDVLGKLEAERCRLQRKIVFRPGTMEFSSLEYKFYEFQSQMPKAVQIVKELEEVKKSEINRLEEEVVDKFCNWQETASCFIDQLAYKYADYIDVTQPVQVAVYEMKFGLSMILAASMERKFLNEIKEDKRDHVMESIYSFMKFPTGCPIKSTFLCFERRLQDISSLDIDCSTALCALNMTLLEKLATSSQLKASLYHSVLVRVTYFVANARLMDRTSFILLDKLFNDFASIWMKMKDEGRTKADLDRQQYKFRTRAFKIETVLDVDISKLGKLLADDSFSEWKDLLCEEESTGSFGNSEQHESYEKEWKCMEESILKDLVCKHNHLFGSTNLVLSSGTFEISDSERLFSFINSYTLGVKMIEVLGGALPFSLDTKLVPENLLRLCLDQEFLLSPRSVSKYNFYKHLNPPMMSKMVEPLRNLQKHTLRLLSEWEDHPGLQKILDVIKMLLAIPVNTPLAKALSGLQFLFNRATGLHESGPKIHLSFQLQPIIDLICSWQKLEFNSCLALLDEVQDQYETEAGMLWFPLFKILDIATSDERLIQNVEEFVETSNIGEFRKRLQLLFAFYGQTSSGRSLGIYSNIWQEKKQHILYNMFGYYVQFLPAVLEHIQTSRDKIKSELESLLKICQWDNVDSLLCIENSKRTRLKLRKLIQKYSDLLQLPVLVIINKAPAQRGVNGSSPQDDKSLVLLDAVLDQEQFSDEYKCTWYGDCRRKLNDYLITLDTAGASEKGGFDAEKVTKIITQQSDLESACLPQQEVWKCVWEKLKTLCQFTKGCDGLWKNATNNEVKKRALSDLLNLLKSSGLQKHMLEKPLKWQFLEPSYDARHLLLTPSRLSRFAFFSASECQDPFDEKLTNEWKLSNEYYFKSIASVKLLEQASFKPREDLNLDQINRSVLFLSRLIVIQQNQRAEAYGFSKQLVQLRGCVSALESFYSDCTNKGPITQDQHTIFKRMWQQKQLLDDLYSLLCEGSLLLRTLEDYHSNVCRNGKPSAKRILDFFENCIPAVKRSKESLDDYLLGHDVAIITVNASSQPYLISRKMEKLVQSNFQVIKDLKDKVVSFKKDISGSSTVDVLLCHFEDVIVKAKEMFEQLNLDLEMSRRSAKYAPGFNGSLEGILENVVVFFQKVCSWNLYMSAESSGDITKWETLVKSCVADMNLDKLCQKLLEMASNFCSDNSICNSSQIRQIKGLLKCLDVILTFANGFLHNLLAVHKTVSVLTHELASILASLFSNGFGPSPKDQMNDPSNEVSQDACGTGIGEGAGIKDISDQIDDEDQLLGASDAAGTEQDGSAEVPNNNDKGIEMEEDFLADAASVSEDSEQDDNDNEGIVEQLDSEMGEAGADSEVVDRKSWNKDEDDNPNDISEKDETGPSATGGEERELRAKLEDASTVDELGDPAGNELNNRDHCTENEDVPCDTKENEDMSMDKEEAFTDSSGLQLDEADQNPDEDMNMDEEETETDFQDGTEEHGEPQENGSENDDPLADEAMEDADAQLGETSEMEVPRRDYQQGSDMNLLERLPGISGFCSGNEESVIEPQGGLQPSYSANTASEADLSRRSEIYSEVAPESSCLSGVDSLITGLSIGGTLTDDQPKSDLPQQEASAQKTQSNPFRNVGDALEDWKHRVKVSIDLQAEKIEEQGEMEIMDACDYGYVDQHEKGTAQTLGPATAEQTGIDANDNDPDNDSAIAHRNEMTDMDVDIEKQQFEEKPAKCSSSSLLNSKVDELAQKRDSDESPQQAPHCHEDGDRENFLDMVFIKRFSSAKDNPSLRENHLEISQALADVSIDEKDDASPFWSRGRLLRLSHELAEQLRLIMEPTVASKLQGDYKTGKRINMRKVIPYIASHYRKDKIWLRRTRPSKRDYQVVIAVDDSLSMSENGCGQVAIEALVTVCHAMSQLEMGNVAVVSFGKKGNVKLLHEFEQPFTVEAGIKMVSNLTFKQDNTASGDPVVDLLKYLSNMLDIRVARARSSSGENLLQQLVLIIGDGRFMEKNLKTYVRDASSWKRMIAYLILDNSKESIMNHLEAVHQPNGNLEFIKYLDCFPFQYYIVLRDIVALPRTLANLLRQWFEVMQYSRD